MTKTVDLCLTTAAKIIKIVLSLSQDSYSLSIILTHKACVRTRV